MLRGKKAHGGTVSLITHPKNGHGYPSEVMRKNHFTQDSNKTPETEKPVLPNSSPAVQGPLHHRLNSCPTIQDMGIVSHD